MTLGLIVIIFGGFRSGFATATEMSAFAALYALVVGGMVFRELGPRAALRSFVACGDALGAGAVHRRRGAGAGVHADLAAGAAPPGGGDDRRVAAAAAPGCSCCCRSPS